MRKMKIVIESTSQHMAIHMIIELIEQLTKAEMSGKTIGHMIMRTDHGSITVEGGCPGDITVTEKLIEDMGTEPEFYRLAKNDTLRCVNIAVYDSMMDQCGKMGVNAYGDREKLTIRFKEPVSEN